MSSVVEIIKGKKDKAICLTAIGEEFIRDFEKISLPHFRAYAKKYDLGLLLLKDYLVEKQKLHKPYDSNPNFQRLLFPQYIKKNFPNYKYICDIDIDCLPGPVARNIFDFTNFENRNDIFLTTPVPPNFLRKDIGKRISLLRQIFQNKDFPLDSLLSASDEDEKKIYDTHFSGHIAVIGTCVANVEILSEIFLEVYDRISTNFGGYLQLLTNKYFRDLGNVKWLPYEFQAIWNYEVALNYPFLFSKKYSHLAKSCVLQSLLKVDMLHFAGNWKENKIFKEGPFLKFDNEMDVFFESLPSFLDKDIEIKSYNKIRD